MTIDGARWTCTLADYVCRTPDVPPPGEIRRGITGPVRGDISAAAPRPRMSPDGKWMAFIDNYNVAIRPFGGDKRMALSTDGSEGNYYDGASLVVVARFVEGRRLSRPPRLSPAGALRRLVARRSTAARTLGVAVCEARRSARSRAAGAVRRPQPEADRDRLAAVPESVRHVRSGVAQGQPRASASNTTSAATRCIASSKSTRRPAPRARSSPKSRRRSSITTAARPRCRPASAIATTSPTARKWCGCRSATAGTIST